MTIIARAIGYPQAPIASLITVQPAWLLLSCKGALDPKPATLHRGQTRSRRRRGIAQVVFDLLERSEFAAHDRVSRIRPRFLAIPEPKAPMQHVAGEFAIVAVAQRDAPSCRLRLRAQLVIQQVAA